MRNALYPGIGVRKGEMIFLLFVNFILFTEILAKIVRIFPLLTIVIIIGHSSSLAVLFKSLDDFKTFSLVAGMCMGATFEHAYSTSCATGGKNRSVCDSEGKNCSKCNRTYNYFFHKDTPIGKL